MLIVRSFFALLFLYAPLMGIAQGAAKPVHDGVLSVDSPTTARTGDVVVTLTPEVQKLLKAYSEHKHPQKGYRVQIFLGDRATAEATKRSFLQRNPDIPAYLSWLAPNFRLRVGDLRTRLEAEHLLRDMKVPYPGSYIVPDEIEMPRVE